MKSVGVIVDNLIVTRNVYQIINYSKSSKNYQVTTLLVNGVNLSFYKRLYYKIKRIGLLNSLSRILLKLLFNFEALLYSKVIKKSFFHQKYDLSSLGFEVIHINPIVSKNQLFYTYGDDDINTIKSLNLECLIRAGGGILKGNILNVCPNGIISYHHGNNLINRGGPPGFWEVYYKQCSTGFIIQRLTEELDGGEVLYRGYIPTSWLYSLNLIKLYTVSAQFLNITLESILSCKKVKKIHQKQPYFHPLYVYPKILQTLYYTIYVFLTLSKKILSKLTFRKFYWNVAYQYCENWNDLALWRSKKIPNPRGRFLADPFVIYKSNKHYCFVEDYSFSVGKASISVYEITKDSCREVGTALKEDFHLSYPFLFEYRGGLYMCPETSQNKDIRIYKCTKFPLEWKLESILLNDISAADSNLFYHENRWWLMCNVATTVLSDHSTELHVYSSECPLSNHWVPHSANPIICDSRKARNGGLIFSNSIIYRTYQKQGFDFYGKGFGVSKIIELNNQEYLEEKMFEVEPKFFNGALGTHTYNYDNGLVVFDYVKK